MGVVLYCHVQDVMFTSSQNGFVPVGSDCTVCVEVDGRFGVVCLDHGSIFCSTCKHGSRSCKHVEYLMVHIQDNEGDIAAALQPFVGVVPVQQNHLHKPYKLLTLSKKKIPFTITPEMKAILRQSYEQRFDIKKEVGHLHPTTMLPCSVCGAEGQWSDEEHTSHSTTIVCSNQIFKAQGIEKKLLTPLFNTHTIVYSTYKELYCGWVHWCT